MNSELLANTLFLAGTTAALASAFGFMAAVAISGASAGIQRLLLGLAVCALALPPFLVTNTWLDLAGAGGWLHKWLPLNAFSLPAAVFLLSLLTWPIPCLLVWAALTKLTPSLVEGDPALRRWSFAWVVLWPLACGSLFLGGTIVFVLALNNFAVPSLLQVKVLPAEVWVAFNTSLSPREAFKAGWPMFVAPVVPLLLACTLVKVRWPRKGGSVVGFALRRQIGGTLYSLCTLVAVTAVLLSVMAPLAQIMFSARTWSEFIPALRAGLNAIGNSSAYATAAAALIVLVGTILSRVPGHPVAWVFFFIPGIFLGIAFAAGLNHEGLNWIYRSGMVVIAALFVRYLAIVWTAARSALALVDSKWVEMLRMEGASGFALFRWAQWPQIAPQVLWAGYLVFLLCLWDVETLILIVPPGGETMALRIYNLLHYGHNAHVNALCVVLLLLSLAPLALWQLWIRRPNLKFGDPVSASLLALLLCGCSRESTPARSSLNSTIFTHAEIIGQRGTGPGQFNKPRSVAVDAEDNLFVADFTGRIQKFSPDGRFLALWHMPQVDLGKAKGMDRDREGNIVIVEPHYQRVNHFNSAGKLVRQWGRSGTNAGELSLPRAVAVDSHSNVIVTEYWSVERVQKFSPDGSRLLGCWGRPGNGPGEMNRPEGVGVDSSDRIYIADSCNHRVQVFSPNGLFLRAYGQPGAGPGQLSYPYDVRVDSEGRQFVCEFGNSRIQVFDANGRSLGIIGKAGSAAGQFSNPWSIALDSKGNLYVADSQNHRVQKLIRAAKS